MSSSGSCFCRDLTTKYCKGNGIDIGGGGDPVIPTAVQIDLPEPDFSRYGHAYQMLVVPQFRSKTWYRELPFKDETLDYVFSSHLLEDFADWEFILREWIRVLKPGGYLIILVPDKIKFQEAVRRTGGGNQAHKHEFYVGELTLWMAREGGFLVIHDDMANGSGTCDYNICFIAKRL